MTLVEMITYSVNRVAGSACLDQEQATLESLAKLGPDAKDALPRLRELAKTRKDPKEVVETIQAIEKK